MKLLSLAIIFSSLSLSASAWAGDLEWGGSYRVEGLKVNGPDMGGSNRDKQYILHHLVLNPKINAYDGITIYSRFDIMNSTQYPNSQVGQMFGSGVGGSTGNGPNINVTSENQKSDMLLVNQLYMTYAHEFGLLTVGRAPIHFGLGMTYNAGMGAFDHWFDNRDMIAYKVVMGNLTFMPVIAKLTENDPGFSDDIDDYMFQVEYDNPESDLKMGLLYRRRMGGRHGNDAPGAPVFGDNNSGPASANPAPFKGTYWNFFIQRYIGASVKFGFEGGMQSGQTGVLAAGQPVSLSGFGAAMELDYIPKDGKFHALLRAGMASGDDPSTPNTYEGYIFDRNYDVAFLLFNHSMGNYDIFRNNAVHNTTTKPSSLVDEDAISNVLYLAPSFKYKWSDRFDSQFGLTYAQLNSDPLSNVGVGKNVGYEIDVTLNYKPYEGIQWVNRLGVFAPGDAYKGGSNNYTTGTVIGLETKAAITF